MDNTVTGFSVDDHKDQIEQFSIDTQTVTAPVAPEVLEQRAFKASVGFKGLNKTQQEIYEDMLQNGEAGIRQEGAAQNDVEKQEKKKSVLNTIALNRKTVTPEDVKYITERYKELDKPTNPDTAIEELFAHEYMQKLYDYSENNPESRFADITKYKTQQVSEEVNARSPLVARNEIVLKKLQEAVSAEQAQTTFGWGLDFAKNLSGIYSEFKLRGQNPNTGFFDAGPLGSNLDRQRREWMLKPIDEFRAEFGPAMDKLIQDNPQIAKQFLQAMLGQSSLDMGATNAVTGLTLFGIPTGVTAGVVKGASRRILGAAESAADKRILSKGVTTSVDSDEGIARKAAADMAAGAAEQPVTPATMAAAAGDASEAAVKAATVTATKELSGNAEDFIRQSVDSLTRNFKVQIDNIRENVGKTLSRESLTRLELAYQSSIDNLVNKIENRIRVQRLPVTAAVEDAMRAIQSEQKALYNTGLDNTILDVSRPFLNPVTNTWHTELLIGKATGELFEDPRTAKNFADSMGLADAKVQQQGGGFYLSVIKPLNETGDAARSWNLKHSKAVEPDGSIKSWVSRLRNPDDIVGAFHRENRKAATYGVNSFLELFKEESKYISGLAQAYRKGNLKLSDVDGRVLNPIYNWSPNKDITNARSLKDRWRQFKEMLDVAQHMTDKDGKVGKWFDSPLELEDFYQTHFKRMPDGDEIQAYFAFRRMAEMDAVLRDLSLYRYKSRVGVEQHKFKLRDKDGNVTESEFIEGIQQRNFPGGSDSIYIMGKTADEDLVIEGGAESLLKGGQTSIEKHNQLQKAVDAGELRVIRIYAPESNPLAEFSSKLVDNSGNPKRIRYVIAPAVETKSLSFEQLPRRGGGHIEYDYKYYIKQAKMRAETTGVEGGVKTFQRWYEGDSTIMPIELRAMGKDIAEKLDNVRELLRVGKKDEAKEFARANLPMEWKVINGWFNHSFDPVTGKKHPPLLNKDERIQVVESGRNIIDMDNSLQEKYGVTLKDGTKQGSDAKQYNVQFTQERDSVGSATIQNYGTATQPIYRMAPVNTINPIASMDRALSRIASSTFMDDYKIYAMESWLQNARDSLKFRPGELESAPFYHFQNPVWKADVIAENKAQLLAQHKAIQMLIGTPSKTDTFLHSVAQRLVDSAYEGSRPYLLAPAYALEKATDGATFLRSATFHAALGLFSPAQLAVQLQTYVTIGSLSPRSVISGTLGAMLTGLSRLNRNPAILDALDKIASTMYIPGLNRYKPGEFKEALKLYDDIGFGKVAGEYAMHDNVYKNQVFRHMGQDFLDAGLVFFRGGEKSSRAGAFHTAYLEFRNKFPTRKIDDAAKNEILQRADDLTVNMSRASSSMLHTGPLQFPMQFLAYQFRLMELFWGKRLGETTAERMATRARMFAIYSGLYGISTSFGITGMPFADSIRKYATENGYITGDSPALDTLFQGLPAAMGALITGGGDIRKGIWYNVGDRFGTGGFENIRDILMADEPFWKILTGATGSKLSGVWEAKDPFIATMMSGIRADDKAFKIKPEHFVEIFKEASSVNSIWRTAMAINTGKWVSKKGVPMENISPLDAIFRGVTGLQSQEASELHLKTGSLKSQRELEKWGEQKAIQELRRAYRAIDEGNRSQGEDYLSNAYAYLHIAGIRPEDMGKIVSRANKGFENLLTTVNYDYYVRKAPSEEFMKRSKLYERYRQLQNYRQGE